MLGNRTRYCPKIDVSFSVSFFAFLKIIIYKRKKFNYNETNIARAGRKQRRS